MPFVKKEKKYINYIYIPISNRPPWITELADSDLDFVVENIQSKVDLLRIRLSIRDQQPLNFIKMSDEKLVCIEDYEIYAAKVLSSNALEYYKSGADEEQTLRENRDSFKR